MPERALKTNLLTIKQVMSKKRKIIYVKIMVLGANVKKLVRLWRIRVKNVCRYFADKILMRHYCMVSKKFLGGNAQRGTADVRSIIQTSFYFYAPKRRPNTFGALPPVTTCRPAPGRFVCRVVPIWETLPHRISNHKRMIRFFTPCR